MNPCRRRLNAAMAFALVGSPLLARAAPPLVEVWKSRNCGCCKDWVKHLEASGFQVKTHDTGNTDARARLGLPVKYGACHTGQVAGYALEGHVPAREVLRLLQIMGKRSKFLTQRLKPEDQTELVQNLTAIAQVN